MTRMRMMAFAGLVSAALGLSLTTLAPANAATSHPVTGSTHLSVSKTASPDYNEWVTLWRYNPTDTPALESDGCIAGAYFPTYDYGVATPEYYLSEIDNTCEYTMYLINADGTSHCVDSGFDGYVPGEYHYPVEVLVGETIGDC
jgi:hypothetical protein